MIQNKTHHPEIREKTVERRAKLRTSGSSGIWMMVLKNSISLALLKKFLRLAKKDMR